MRAIIVVFFILLIHCSVFGQGMVFKNYTSQDGLPSMQVYDIYQDVNGYLWFATDRGISRYNGYSFESFSSKDGITSNTVFKFFPQSNGDIWCTTINNKLFYFNPKDYKFVAYKFNDILSSSIADYVPNDFLLLKDGSVSISFIGYTGIFTLDSEGNVLNNVNIYTIADSDKYENGVFQTIEKVEGNYFGSLVANGEELDNHFKSSTIVSSQLIPHSFHSKTTQFGDYCVFKSSNEVYLKKGNQLIKIIDSEFRPINVGKIDEHSFWVGYRGGGVVIYNELGEVVSSYLHGKSITYLFKDHEGAFWFSSLSSGVFYVEDPTVRYYEFDGYKHVYQLAQDNENRLWVSTYNRNLYLKEKGQLIKKLNSHLMIYPISKQDNSYSLNWKSASSIEIANNTTVNFTGGVRFDVDEGRQISKLRSYGGSKVILSRVNASIKQNNDYYLGTNKGLFICDSNNLKLTRHKSTKLSSRIEDIVVFNKDVYFATIGEGVVYGLENPIKTLTETEGLYSNYINKTYNEGDSLLWVCTNKGVNIISIQESGPTVLESRAFFNKNITDIEIINDTVWVGTWEGLFSMPKSSVKKVNTKPSFFKLLQININGFSKEIGELLDLEYYQNNIDIKFQSISFKETSQLYYRYRIEGLEKEWNYTQNTNISYPSLPFGTYVLTIEVSSDSKLWESNKLIVPFNIMAPYYKTNWFYSLLLFVLILLIYLFFKLKVLSYNKKVVSELILLIARKINKGEKYIVIREQGKEVKIFSHQILYVKSSGNYCEIYTQDRKHVTRLKIGEFLSIIPDKLEYLQIHRSCIVRVDKIMGKSKDTVIVGDIEMKVSNTFLKELKKIQL